MDDAPDVAGMWAGREVTVGGEPLSPSESLAVARHSADGFAWGHGGSGSAQLALAILLRFADRATARRVYQAFKWECIATLPQADFRLRGEDVRAWLAAKAAEPEGSRRG